MDLHKRLKLKIINEMRCTVVPLGLKGPTGPVGDAGKTDVNNDEGWIFKIPYTINFIIRALIGRTEYKCVMIIPNDNELMVHLIKRAKQFIIKDFVSSGTSIDFIKIQSIESNGYKI